MKIKKVAFILYVEQVVIVGSNGVKQWADVRTVFFLTFFFFWHYSP
jgi:hypothetical protein